MAEPDQKSNITAKKWGGAVLTAVILAAAAAIWYQQRCNLPEASFSNPEGQSDAPVAEEQYKSRTVEDEKRPPNKKAAEFEEMALAQLAVAAEFVTAAKPIEEPVSRRPEFVAEFEWEIIQKITGRNPVNEKKQIQLINKLLFFKKWEAWRSLLGSERQTAERHELAREIFGMIPSQMEILGLRQAQEMKNKLLADLNEK